MSDDWADDPQFPTPQPGPSADRLKVRFGVSLLVAIAQLLIFWDLVLSSLQFIWPPTEPRTQWVTFILVSVGSFTVISVLIGTLIGDQLYDRWLKNVM
ncbi:hypothetical protein HUB97_07730 [Halorubraceae archaeon YAN]|nr:hypothetical protein [Halorubraceae archaeon YAN]